MDKREYVYFDSNELIRIIRSRGSNLNQAAYDSFYDENTGRYYGRLNSGYLYTCCSRGLITRRALEKVCIAYNINIESLLLPDPIEKFISPKKEDEKVICVKNKRYRISNDTLFVVLNFYDDGDYFDTDIIGVFDEYEKAAMCVSEYCGIDSTEVDLREHYDVSDKLLEEDYLMIITRKINQYDAPIKCDEED